MNGIEIKVEGDDLVIRLLEFDDQGEFVCGQAAIPLADLRRALAARPTPADSGEGES